MVGSFSFGVGSRFLQGARVQPPLQFGKPCVFSCVALHNNNYVNIINIYMNGGAQVVSLVCERSRCPCGVIATYMYYMMDVLPTTCRQQTRQQLKSEKKKIKCAQVVELSLIHI